MSQTILDNPDLTQELMGKAIKQAILCSATDVPVGAVVAHLTTGEIISQSYNSREKNSNPFEHAEISAIQHAAKTIGDWRLGDYCIFSTLEPCLMCAGALVQSRIGAVVFGAYDLQFGAAGSIYNFFADPRLTHNPKVVRGIKKDRCQDLLDSFFESKRNN